MSRFVVSVTLAALLATVFPVHMFGQVPPPLPEPLPAAHVRATPGAAPPPVGPRILPLDESTDVLKRRAGSRIPGATEYTEPVICSGVARSVRVLNPNMVLGEPAVLQFRAVGLDPHSTSDFVAAMAFGNDVQVLVVPVEPAGYPFVFSPERRPRAVPNSVFSLLEGETSELTMIMAHDYNSLSGAGFDAPGRYRLEVSLNCKGSNTREGQELQFLGTIEVTVAAPERDDDRLAWEILSRDSKVFKSIQDLNVQSLGDRELLTQVVERARHATVRPYALLSVATQDFLKGRDDSEALDRAIRSLSQFLEEYPNHFLADSCQARLMRSLMEKKDRQGARELFLRMWTDPVSSQRLRPTDSFRRTFLGEPPKDNTEQWMIFRVPDVALKPEPTPFVGVDNSEDLPIPFLEESRD